MNNGDIQFSAAILSRLHKQQEAFTGLTSALESSLADVAASLDKPAVAQALGAIESALADLVGAVARDPDTKAIEGIAAAIAALKLGVTVNVPEGKAPVVNVQVQPTPITVEAVMPTIEIPAPVLHFMPAPPAALGTWEVTIPGEGYNAPNRKMTIKRLA